MYEVGSGNQRCLWEMLRLLQEIGCHYSVHMHETLVFVWGVWSVYHAHTRDIMGLFLVGGVREGGMFTQGGACKLRCIALAVAQFLKEPGAQNPRA